MNNPLLIFLFICGNKARHPETHFIPTNKAKKSKMDYSSKAWSCKERGVGILVLLLVPVQI